MDDDIENIERNVAKLELRVQFFENAIADVNASDDMGWTALHRAAASGDEGMILILAKNKANWLCLTNEEEETPLHLAVTNGHLGATELILRNYEVYPKSFLVDAKTRTTGSTALHISVQMQRIDLVRCLLKFEAKYLIQDKKEKTPVDLARDPKIIKLFDNVIQCFNLFENYDPKLLEQLQTVSNEDLLAIGNAAHETEYRSLYNRLMCNSGFRRFLDQAWNIIYEAKQKDNEYFQKTYVNRTHRCRS